MNPRAWGWATLVANIGLVLTGGAVRLTGSGLGCPTWPRCTAESYVPHGALDIHEAIEFGNRMLTFGLVAIAIGTWLAARRSGRAELRRLSLGLALGIPAQAIIGGVTVLTKLNPWVVSLHLMCSMAIIAAAVVFLRRAGRARAYGPKPAPHRLAWATWGAAWVTIYLGTVVTGSGPHAGDQDAVRNGLDSELVSQLHSVSVWLLLAVTAGLVLKLRRDAQPLSGTPVLALFVVEVGQGVIGYAQYLTGLPAWLVELHLLGSALTMATATWTWHWLTAESKPAAPVRLEEADAAAR